jgi:hypothetical protein
MAPTTLVAVAVVATLSTAVVVQDLEALAVVVTDSMEDLHLARGLRLHHQAL